MRYNVHSTNKIHYMHDHNACLRLNHRNNYKMLICIYKQKIIIIITMILKYRLNRHIYEQMRYYNAIFISICN